MIENDQKSEDSLKEMESLAEPLANEISKIGKNSVPLPSMPREAKIESISKDKQYANIIFTIKGENDDDKEVPILQSMFKIKKHTEALVVGAYSATLNIEHTVELDLKKGDKVLIAYKDGKLGSPVIIGKLPKE